MATAKQETDKPQDKLRAAPPEVRRVKPAVEASRLRHRELRDDPFWTSIPSFADVDEETFLNHIWQMRNSAYKKDQLVELLREVAPEDFVADVEAGFERAPMAVRVTPYLLGLIDWENPYDDPIRRQFIPVASSLLEDHPMLSLDSLHEQADAPVSGLTHRYEDKALFLPLNTCPVYCRFCTRSYAIGIDTEMVEKVNLRVDPERWEAAFDYIASRPELEDIVISGGDAFNLAAKHIETIGMRLLQMPHIRRLRFATKGLAVMPMKILSDDKWFDALSRVVEHGRKLHKQVVIHTHFNTANEITEISRRAMNRLFENGIVVRNQTVLQQGVNDSDEAMWSLVKGLGEINIHPYYVYQHDMVRGVEDLRTSVQTNMDLEVNLRGSTAGFNIPLFIVDAPGGGGKRDIHSWVHYDRASGVSVYRAPAVKEDQLFFYFDPLHSLSDEVQERWRDPVESKVMVEEARQAALDAH